MEEALLPINLLNEGNQTQFYSVSVRTFMIPFYFTVSGTVMVTGTVTDYGSGAAKANYGSYDS
jgi:hypothetical protein